MAASSDLERELRGASLRVTRPRLAVLAAVHAYPHADTPSLIAHVRDDLADVSTQAVYDVLSALHGAGLIRRIQPEGSVARYEARTGDNHHHVVCRTCGAIADVDCAVGHTPCLTASHDHGFVIDEAEVIYWGACPDCQTTRPAADARYDASRHSAVNSGVIPAASASESASPHAAHHQASSAEPAAPVERGAPALTPPTSSEPPRGSHA